ncbi:TniB family NTP-binding protein [Photobacterium damselae subsp. damselae]|uniref:TniB family NTP-binding protein n=1 Tax=Photobacterium damselae TaxID=38293 RepID=UPI001E613D38|nr:TniB family NTP-binding protein [Photobacterium damselae]UJZ95350.1 TniB family NTP-binding protein [Photobacterium damselae subsp. damselae]UJZ99326.1 TniB family NTP-binding protein [Photobacterium damselae subsp. damselae]
MRRNLDRDEVLANYHDSFSIYPEVEKVFSGLDWIMRRRKFGSFAPSMLLTAGTGAGKSATINYYIENNLSRNEVLITRVRPTLLETLLWMAKELGAYRNSRAKPSDIGLTDRVIETSKRVGLKLLVIEECQELFERTSHNQRQDIRDRLKMISDECRLPIVFVGLHSAELILEDSQWNRRIMVRRTLPYIKITDESAIDNYLDVLEALEKTVPLPFKVPLTDVDFAMRLLSASKGVLGEIKELIAAALEVALENNKHCISEDNFATVYQKINGFIDTNPFTVEIDELTIEQIASYENYVTDADTGELRFVKQAFSKLSIQQLVG